MDINCSQGELPFPKLLYSRVRGDTDDVLVLEDLIPAGFTPGERRSRLDKAHCQLVAEQLARLHARSLAAKLLCPEKLHSARQDLTEVVFFPGARHSFGLSIHNSLKMAADALRRYFFFFIFNTKLTLNIGLLFPSLSANQDKAET
jgi:hypothetical protein